MNERFIINQEKKKKKGEELVNPLWWFLGFGGFSSGVTKGKIDP